MTAAFAYPLEDLGIIGRGGSGVVHRVRDRRTGRILAAKRVPVRSEAERAHLRREFRRLRSVRHPCVVRLAELRTEGDDAWFTMAYVPGRHFVDAVRDGVGPDLLPRSRWPALGAALVMVGEAVAALHDAGLVHRDLKSSNVLLTPEGEVRVVDLGFAGLAWSQGPEGVSGSPEGTLAYMAPERFAGVAGGPAVDWWGVGCLAWEALVGTAPGVHASGWRSLATPVPPPELPREIALLLTRLLEEDPQARGDLSTVLELADRLGAGRAGGIVAPRLVGREALEASMLEVLRDEGRASLVLTGPAGIGKTALLRRLRKEAIEHGLFVLSARSDPMEHAPLPVADAVAEDLVDALNVVQPDWHRSASAAAAARMLPALTRAGVRPTPSATRSEVVDGFRTLLNALAEHGAVALVIDDLPLCDPDSERLLVDLMEVDPPWSVVATTARVRPSEGSPGAEFLRAVERFAPPRWLDVGRLDAEALSHLAAMHGLDVPGEEEARVAWLRASRGHPLLALELLRDPHAAESLPRGVEAAFGGRFLRLAPRHRTALGLLAVAGVALPERVVLGAVDRSMVEERVVAIDDLVGMGLLSLDWREGVGHVSTFHDTVREGVLAVMSAEERRSRARELEVALEAVGDVAGVGLTDLPMSRDRPDAVERERAAGFRALESLAWGAALVRLGEARRLGADDAELHEAMARAYEGLGRYQEVARARERAHALRGHEHDDISSRARLAMFRVRAGELQEGGEELAQIVRELGMPLARSSAGAMARAATLRLAGWSLPRGLLRPDRPAEERLEALWMASTAMAVIDHLQSDAYCAAYHRLAERAGGPRHRIRARAWDAAFRARFTGTWLGRGARERAEAAQRDADDLGDAYEMAWARTCVGTVGWFSADWHTCRSSCEDALTRFRALPEPRPWEEVLTVGWLVGALWKLGDTAAFRRSVREQAWRYDAGDRFTLNGGHHESLSIASLLDGDIERAESWIDEARAQWPEGEEPLGSYSLGMSRARVALYRGDPVEAWSVLRDAEPLVTRFQVRRVSVLAAELDLMEAVAAAGAHGRCTGALEAARRAASRLRRGRETATRRAYAAVAAAAVADAEEASARARALRRRAVDAAREGGLGTLLAMLAVRDGHDAVPVPRTAELGVDPVASARMVLG